jgi:hypothetical protein
MEHPAWDFHDELNSRDELTYHNAKSPASAEAGLALTAKEANRAFSSEACPRT